MAKYEFTDETILAFAKSIASAVENGYTKKDGIMEEIKAIRDKDSDFFPSMMRNQGNTIFIPIEPRNLIPDMAYSYNLLSEEIHKNLALVADGEFYQVIDGNEEVDGGIPLTGRIVYMNPDGELVTTYSSGCIMVGVIESIVPGKIKLIDQGEEDAIPDAPTAFTVTGSAVGGSGDDLWNPDAIPEGESESEENSVPEGDLSVESEVIIDIVDTLSDPGLVVITSGFVWVNYKATNDIAYGGKHLCPVADSILPILTSVKTNIMATAYGEIRLEEKGRYESVFAYISGTGTNFMPVTSYKVEVINGTASGTGRPGETVSIQATVPNDSNFDRWTVESGSVIFEDPYSANTSFVMPNCDVTVKANMSKKHIL